MESGIEPEVKAISLVFLLLHSSSVCIINYVYTSNNVNNSGEQCAIGTLPTKLNKVNDTLHIFFYSLFFLHTILSTQFDMILNMVSTTKENLCWELA